MRVLLTVALIYFAWRAVNNTTWYSSTEVSENIAVVTNHINYNIIVECQPEPQSHNQVESKQGTEVSDKREPSIVEVTNSVKNTRVCGFPLAPVELAILRNLESIRHKVSEVFLLLFTE